MTSLDRTRALAAALAEALGLEALKPDNNNSYPLLVDGRTIFLFGGDDVTILLVAPVAELPESTSYGLAAYLLRKNLFQSDMQPFQVALDNGGTVVVWGRLQIDDLDGPTLAAVIKKLGERAADMAEEIAQAA